MVAKPSTTELYSKHSFLVVTLVSMKLVAHVVWSAFPVANDIDLFHVLFDHLRIFFEVSVHILCPFLNCSCLFVVKK